MRFIHFLSALMVFSTMNLGLLANPQPFNPDPVQQAEKQERVNINQATQAQLETLPRVGPATAKRIIEFREEHKGFKTLEELMNVKGIGPKTFEKLKNLIEL